MSQFNLIFRCPYRNQSPNDLAVFFGCQLKLLTVDIEITPDVTGKTERLPQYTPEKFVNFCGVVRCFHNFYSCHGQFVSISWL